MAETFRRMSSPIISQDLQTSNASFVDGSSATAGGQTPSGSTIAKSKVLESVHSKFFEMLLMLNGTSDVPCAVERWLACVVNASHQQTLPSDQTTHSGAHGSHVGSGGDCSLIIPSITANVSSAINRVQAKLSREQDAQKDVLNSLKQRLEQVEREREKERNSPIKCPNCETRARTAVGEESCASCVSLRKQLKERLACTECSKLRRQLEEYESALASCPNCDRLEVELELATSSQLAAESSLSCNRCEDLKQALESCRISYDSRVAALQAEFEGRLQEQLRIGEEVHKLPRWQNELEQVRQLCDKGIELVEDSHKAAVARMREHYENALRLEREEKERLINEETQATKVALEAIRREHCSQLAQLKAQSQQSTQPTTKPPEVETEVTDRRLSEIKDDIQNISEKFSKKCVEAAAVQERLYATQKQLQKANTQLFDVLASRARSDVPSHRMSPTCQDQGAKVGLSAENVPKAPLVRSKTTLDSSWQNNP